MADRSQQLILTALSQSLGQGEALPLHGSRSRPGLFPSTSAGKQAAVKCHQEGWIADGDDGCCITEKGMRYLLSQVSPRQVLEDLVRALEARHEEVDRLVATAQRMQASLEGLRANAERVLSHLDSPPETETPIPAHLNRLFQQFRHHDQAPVGPATMPTPAVQPIILEALAAWPAGASEDCPLTTLYQQVIARLPGTTIGTFHDALRDLARQDRLLLQPWTGPLPLLPEPSIALLDGHQIAYYASQRRPA